MPAPTFAPPKPPRTRWQRWAWPLAILLGWVALQLYFAAAASFAPIPYSEFLVELRNHNIADMRIASDRIEGTYKSPRANGASAFTTLRVEPELARDLDLHDVKFAAIPDGGWFAALLSWLMPALVFAAGWMLFMRPGKEALGGGLLSIGKSRAKIFAETGIKVTFDDVAGVDEAKAELQEVVDFLKDPAGHSRLGARMPKGILLVGPPGTGKTLLARAVAGQAAVPFFSINGSEFVELFVGVGAARVRDLFDQARAAAPAIVFIDEIDALGRARGAWNIGGQDEKEQTLNQLLAEMDGFDPRSGVVLLAATNRPEILDAALLRAGRFDRQVLLDRPDRPGRVQILAVHLKKIRGADDVDDGAIAALTPGFTGADLANLVNEAALLATRRGASEVSMADFTAGIERIVAGLERRNRILDPRERRIIAVHEMGHALVALSIPGADKVHKVSIIPRGVGALGYTLQRPGEDRFVTTRAELEQRMAILLGGRAAETLLIGEVSTGAQDDLARATDIARGMVMRFGMEDSIGLATYERQPFALLAPAPELTPQPRQFSEATGRDIDTAVRRLLDEAFGAARATLALHEALLERAAGLLLARESLDEAQLESFRAEMARAPRPGSEPSRLVARDVA